MLLHKLIIMAFKSPDMIDVQIHYGGRWKDDIDYEFAYHYGYIGGSLFLIEDVPIPLPEHITYMWFLEEICKHLNLPINRAIDLWAIQQSCNLLCLVTSDSLLRHMFLEVRPWKGGGFIHFFCGN